MGKRANPMAVKAALTYDINEAARALGVTPPTIRNWIKDGLPVMASCKPYLILGAAIRDYLRTKRETKKRPLAPDQLYCLSCGAPRRPENNAVTGRQIAPNTTLLKGVCESCSGTCTRMISKQDITKFADIFQIMKEASSTP